MAVIIQFVTKPNPGSDPAKILEIVKESAGLWRKHGGDVSFWTVIGGEIGNNVFAVRFANFAAYGVTMDKLAADPAFQAWQMKRAKAGLTTWVRSNIATDIEI